MKSMYPQFAHWAYAGNILQTFVGTFGMLSVDTYWVHSPGKFQMFFKCSQWAHLENNIQVHLRCDQDAPNGNNLITCFRGLQFTQHVFTGLQVSLPPVYPEPSSDPDSSPPDNKGDPSPASCNAEQDPKM